MDEHEVLRKIIQTGISEHDAKVVADCVVTRKSCSWVNTDLVTRDAVKKLLALLTELETGANLSIKEVSTREKYIWEVRFPPAAAKK